MPSNKPDPDELTVKTQYFISGETSQANLKKIQQEIIRILQMEGYRQTDVDPLPIGPIQHTMDFRLFDGIPVEDQESLTEKAKNLFGKSGNTRGVREMTEDERRLFQEFADTVHRQFIADVARGREMETADVAKIADGRIMCGQTAREYGLIDRMGNMADAVDWAAEKGGIKGEPKTVTLPEEKLPLVKYFMDKTSAELRQWISEAQTGSLSGGYMFDPGAEP